MLIYKLSCLIKRQINLVATFQPYFKAIFHVSLLQLALSWQWIKLVLLSWSYRFGNRRHDLSGAFKFLWILSYLRHWGAKWGTIYDLLGCNSGAHTTPLDEIGVPQLHPRIKQEYPHYPLGWNRDISITSLDQIVVPLLPPWTKQGYTLPIPRWNKGVLQPLDHLSPHSLSLILALTTIK